jgi:hypothetical protein
MRARESVERSLKSIECGSRALESDANSSALSAREAGH